MRKTLIISILSLLMLCCRSQDCDKLPQHFSSYKEAISQVKSRAFKFKDEANTSRSSWLTSAKYYSCDGNTGYFVYITNREYEYIHQGVPIEIWRNFKNSSSLGSYYNKYIKSKYRLNLN
jgi:hypothetical protein